MGKLVGTSAAMQEVYRLIEMAAPTPAPVLITGESGTGKELVARTLHELSARGQGPVRRRELRGHPGDAAGERDLRPREGRLHRRARAPPGLLRAGARGHDLPRRDRRDGAGHPGQVPPHPQDGAVRRLGGRRPRSRWTCGCSRRRTRIRSRPCRRSVPRGSLLPPECRQLDAAAAARAARRHPAAASRPSSRSSTPSTTSRSVASTSRRWRALMAQPWPGQRPRAAATRSSAR